MCYGELQELTNRFLGRDLAPYFEVFRGFSGFSRKVPKFTSKKEPKTGAKPIILAFYSFMGPEQANK